MIMYLTVYTLSTIPGVRSKRSMNMRKRYSHYNIHMYIHVHVHVDALTIRGAFLF